MIRMDACSGTGTSATRRLISHYRRFGELQLQGRIHEAMAELEMAVKLDPLDPANHFTLGSY